MQPHFKVQKEQATDLDCFLRGMRRTRPAAHLEEISPDPRAHALGRPIHLRQQLRNASLFPPRVRLSFAVKKSREGDWDRNNRRMGTFFASVLLLASATPLAVSFALRPVREFIVWP